MTKSAPAVFSPKVCSAQPEQQSLLVEKSNTILSDVSRGAFYKHHDLLY
jgi:hypothetical protein